MAKQHHPKSNDFKTGILVAGLQVVGPQGAVIADSTGSGDDQVKINAILAHLRATGSIATA